MIKAASFSPDSQKLAIASSLGVYIYDIDSPTEHRLFTTSAIVNSVAFAADGLTIAYGLWDNTIAIRDIQTGQLLRSLKGHDSLVNDLEFAPNGQLLASGSADSTIKLWDVRTGQLLRNLKVDIGPVLDVAFSPDSRLIASVSNDDEVRVWEAQTGQLIHALKNLNVYSRPNATPAIAFSPDSRVLAAVFDEALWLIDTRSGQSSLAPKNRLQRHSSPSYLMDGPSLLFPRRATGHSGIHRRAKFFAPRKSDV